MQARDSAVLRSPSFDSGLTEIAARVVEECASEEKSDTFFYDEFYFGREVDSESVKRVGDREWDGDEDGGIEFEFEFGTRDSESSTISADEIFHEGKIRPVYPFISGDLLIRKVKMDAGVEESGKKKTRLPLMKLLIEEREAAAAAVSSSCSSSEVDELEGVPEELYCVWQPKDADELQEGVPEEMYCVWHPKTTPAAAGSPEETARRCKKSSSTGYIYKKLKLKELLRRSRSEGRKDSFVIIAPKNSKVEDAPELAAGKLRPPPPRRTYLPYRQDLVGFFSGGNVLTKNSKPF
ncbi:hypothetical protein F511_10411 [Dorcoceras hygrometricum]|uniref:Uncharacterized protein n=1 Tax=Dorcoceras hygrometricum TaxID=472368 RepID=A0A2Z7CK00_9LAMI|nr:hypothetical protein F511_10411 [Dorcoceras hygrometricum]